MTEPFALQYIPRRMKQLGYGDDYFLAFRHFIIPALDSLDINAGDELFIQLSPLGNLRTDELRITVESEFGFFDEGAGGANEMVYEHRGRIRITNLSDTDTGHIQFIQVIPKNKI